jgi:hypothetical protein
LVAAGVADTAQHFTVHPCANLAAAVCCVVNTDARTKQRVSGRGEELARRGPGRHKLVCSLHVPRDDGIGRFPFVANKVVNFREVGAQSLASSRSVRIVATPPLPTGTCGNVAWSLLSQYHPRSFIVTVATRAIALTHSHTHNLETPQESFTHHVHNRIFVDYRTGCTFSLSGTQVPLGAAMGAKGSKDARKGSRRKSGPGSDKGNAAAGGGGGGGSGGGGGMKQRPRKSESLAISSDAIGGGAASKIVRSIVHVHENSPLSPSVYKLYVSGGRVRSLVALVLHTLSANQRLRTHAALV